VFTLALDTCDARGSIALFENARLISVESHPVEEEYSSWLLPAVDRLLGAAGISHSDLASYAVASGPGSFTGVRLGLTTAKAWAEVYGKPILPVSRLAALADQAPPGSNYVAAFIDAQRKQIFAALYQRSASALKLVSDEQVVDPEQFFDWVAETSRCQSLSWLSLDPEILEGSSFWQKRLAKEEAVTKVNPPLAPLIGLHALTQGAKVDALALDANYVRRSDAEIFGKKAAGT